MYDKAIKIITETGCSEEVAMEALNTALPEIKADLAESIRPELTTQLHIIAGFSYNPEYLDKTIEDIILKIKFG